MIRVVISDDDDDDGTVRPCDQDYICSSCSTGHLLDGGFREGDSCLGTKDLPCDCVACYRNATKPTRFDLLVEIARLRAAFYGPGTGRVVREAFAATDPAIVAAVRAADVQAALGCHPLPASGGAK